MRVNKKTFEGHFTILDLETIPDPISINSEFWIKKRTKKDLTDADAALDPIFGRIISVAWKELFIKVDNYNLSIHQSAVKASCCYAEDIILDDFNKYLKQNLSTTFVAHNGYGFDYHFYAKRCLYNDIELPEQFKIAGLKPWNIRHIDTVELMKFVSNNYHSLDELAFLFGVKSSKTFMDGSQVYTYYLQNKLDEIKSYNIDDVIALSEIFIKMIKLGAHNLW